MGAMLDERVRPIGSAPSSPDELIGVMLLTENELGIMESCLYVPAAIYSTEARSREACRVRGEPTIAVAVFAVQPPIFCGLPETNRILSMSTQRPSLAWMASFLIPPAGGVIGTGRVSSLMIK